MHCPSARRVNRPGDPGGSIPREGGWSNAQTFPILTGGVRERAVTMVAEDRHEYPSQWATETAVAAKIGVTAQTLHAWVRQAEVDGGARSGLTTDEKKRMKELERENKELRRANEILKALRFRSREGRSVAAVHSGLSSVPGAKSIPRPRGSSPRRSHPSRRVGPVAGTARVLTGCA